MKHRVSPKHSDTGMAVVMPTNKAPGSDAARSEGPRTLRKEQSSCLVAYHGYIYI